MKINRNLVWIIVFQEVNLEFRRKNSLFPGTKLEILWNSRSKISKYVVMSFHLTKSCTFWHLNLCKNVLKVFCVAGANLLYRSDEMTSNFCAWRIFKNLCSYVLWQLKHSGVHFPTLHNTLHLTPFFCTPHPVFTVQKNLCTPDQVLHTIIFRFLLHTSLFPESLWVPGSSSTARFFVSISLLRAQGSANETAKNAILWHEMNFWKCVCVFVKIVCDCMWQNYVCERLYVTRLCVCQRLSVIN
jgi:hypothetical protein